MLLYQQNRIKKTEYKSGIQNLFAVSVFDRKMYGFIFISKSATCLFRRLINKLCYFDLAIKHERQIKKLKSILTQIIKKFSTPIFF